MNHQIYVIYRHKKESLENGSTTYYYLIKYSINKLKFYEKSVMNLILYQKYILSKNNNSSTSWNVFICVFIEIDVDVVRYRLSKLSSLLSVRSRQVLKSLL